MYGGGSTSVKPDKRIGKAAMESAQVGRDFLNWSKERAKVTDAWSREDRLRSKTVFQPLEDKFIRDAARYDSAGRQRSAVREARADVFSTAKAQTDAATREMASMGVRPDSGRWSGVRRALGVDTALAAAGAGNMARERVRSTGRALQADAVNMGKGLAVNPLSSHMAGTSTVAAGVQGAQQGLGQQMQGLGMNQNVKVANAQMAAQGQGAMFEGLGTLAGFAMMSSDENVKKDRRPARGILKAVREMPADRWKYKDDAPHADGGQEHIGPMAQDFAKATGTGDGKRINVVDAIGVGMAAIQELDRKVTRLARGLPGPKARKAA